MQAQESSHRILAACACAVLTGTLWQTAGYAQAPASPTATPEQKQQAADPSLASRSSLPNTAAVLQASKDSTTAAVQLSTSFGSPSLEWYVAAKASTPVTSSSAQTPSNIANLDGLTSASTVQLSLSPVYWNVAAPDPNGMQSVCNKYHVVGDCVRLALPNDQAKDEFDKAGNIHYGVPVFGQIAGQVGYQQFQYLDPSALTSETASHAPVSFNASFGALFTGFGYAGLSYRYQVAYTPGTQESVCRGSATVRAHVRITRPINHGSSVG
jgi:hypothetical protein